MSRQLSNGPHLITCTPSMTRCRLCGHSVLAATVDGLDRHIDPDPLTQVGELGALMAGRPTFNLSGELFIRRTVEHIRGDRPGPVMAGHNCTTTPDEHIDGAYMTAAISLVQELLGGVIVDDLPTDPPF